MPAEIIAIGTELTTGAKLDTNSQWLSLELAAIGIPVGYHTTVADDLAANIAVLRNAIERADLVLISGGLGPTLDDLTRDALAAVLDVPLVLHEPSLAVIRQMFARRNREMPERNVVQAMFPEGTAPIPNTRGTAPGIYAEIARPGRAPCLVAAMPGVPSEMKGMFRDCVLPRIAPPDSLRQVIRHARVHLFGVGESAAEQMLGDVTARGRDPEVGITVHEATITLRIVAHGTTGEEADLKIVETRKLIYERMGNLAFGEDDDELEHVVLRMLDQREQTVATAEAGTGGLVAQRLSAVAGRPGVYRGSFVAPTSAACALAAGVDPTETSAGSLPTADIARQLARAARQRCGADFGLAATEYTAEETQESTAPAPVLYLALADASGEFVRELEAIGDPVLQRSRAAKALLNLLRLRLLHRLDESASGR